MKKIAMMSIVLCWAGLVYGKVPSLIESAGGLERLGREVVQKCRQRMKDGTIVYSPDAGGKYQATWLRDYVYTLESGWIPKTEIDNATRVFIGSIRSDGAGVDCVKYDRTPIYRPGFGRFGENPVADGSPFTVSAAYLSWKTGGSPYWLTPVSIQRLTRCLAATPHKPGDDSGLVWIDPAKRHDRAPYGFTDTIPKQGYCFFETLLEIEAGERLAEMCAAAGNTVQSIQLYEKYSKVRERVNREFWDPKVGLYRAATHFCREHDIWGSAFAVWLGVAPDNRADTIARYFKKNYNGLVFRGQVRHNAVGQYWPRGCPRDVYQNGAYWGTPSGWFAWTLERVAPELVDRLFADLVADYRKRGVGEWTFGEKMELSRGYAASVAMPYRAIRRILSRRGREISAGDTWIPFEDAGDVRTDSALDFSKIVPLETPAGKYGHLRNVNGHFEFEKLPGVPRRFSGVNLCFSATYPPREEALRQLDRIQKLGCNSIRLHHFDNEIFRNAERFAKFDFFFAEAVKRGFYITLDLYTFRSVSWRDIGIDRAGDVPFPLYKLLVAVNDGAFADWAHYAKKFLEHVNPYTGRRYASEPALAMISLVNEDSFTQHWRRARELPGFRERVQARCGGTYPENLQTAPHAEAAVQLITEISGNAFAKMSHVVRGTGCRALLTDCNCGINPAPLKDMKKRLYDYVDDHFYVDHPVTPSVEAVLNECAGRNPLAGARPPFEGVGQSRISGKPYVITEWNFAAPGMYRGVAGLMAGSYAAAKDWDGMWRFSFSNRRDASAMKDVFNIVADPIALASERIMAPLFLRRDMALETADRRDDGYDGRSGAFKVATPRTCGVSGSRGELSSGVLTVGGLDGPTTVWATSLDGKELGKSARITMAQLTDAQLEGRVFADATAAKLLCEGTGRRLIRRARTRVTLVFTDGRRRCVYALDNSGKRIAEVESTWRDGSLTFIADGKVKSRAILHWEIIPCAERKTDDATVFNVRDFSARGDGVADDSAAIQSALDKKVSGMRRVFIPKGNYRLKKTLRIGSDTEIRCASGVRMFACGETPRRRGDFLATNADHVKGNQGISIIGGVWDGNCIGKKLKRSPFPAEGDSYPTDAWSGVTLDFTGVKGLRLEDVTVSNSVSFNIRMCRIEDFCFRGIRFASEKRLPNQDGLHFNGFCRNGRIEDVSAGLEQTGDDLLAFNADDIFWRDYNFDHIPGPIENITVKDVYAEDCHSAIRFLSITNAIRNIDISEVHAGVRIHAVNADAARYCRTPIFRDADHPDGVGVMENVVLRDSTFWFSRTNVWEFPMFMLETNARSFRIENCRRLRERDLASARPMVRTRGKRTRPEVFHASVFSR